MGSGNNALSNAAEQPPGYAAPAVRAHSDHSRPGLFGGKHCGLCRMTGTKTDVHIYAVSREVVR